jgi:squalene-hopene/tetraprenyl-beta-curcumene cyclase
MDLATSELMTGSAAAESTAAGATAAAANAPGATAAIGDARAQGSAVLDRAVRYLVGLQHGDGHWRGLLETNVTMDAEDLLMGLFLGVRTAEQTEQAARWIRSQQRADGSWSNFRGGPADPSTTAEAYVALKLAGDDPEAPHMVRARGIVLAAGGLDGTRVFTRMWLALFGLWDWRDVPALPPEIVFLPAWFPLNLYDFGCWARQTIAPLTVLSALRPTRALGLTVDELRLATPTPRRTAGSRVWGPVFRGLDRMLHGYHKLPVKPLRRTAIGRITEWIIARQEADGCWGGIQPPWVYSLMALSVLGYANDHPVMARGLAGWERFTVQQDSPDGMMRWIEACQSPVWDTALATVALADARQTDSPAARAAVDWLLGEEISVTGDWAARRPGLAPGGWY